MPANVTRCLALHLTIALINLCQPGYAQLTVTDAPNATALAQKLVGEGVTISNVSFTGNLLMTGLFKRTGNSAPGIDSGIVLTSGRAKTQSSSKGVDGNNYTMARDVLASTGWQLPGDANLAAQLGVNVSTLKDACVLEFDFIPTGDSIRFRYVFSSEEYSPTFACGNYNDAFAFFISGPGITGLQNIALVPGTSQPVSISSINNVYGAWPAPCFSNTQYYRDNSTGTALTHDGMTTVLTAKAQVTPCQTYHLKLVIADNTDAVWDSGVFLEARSLTSNTVLLHNDSQVDALGNDYLVEGCRTGTFTIERTEATPDNAFIYLNYGGDAIPGVDYETLPPTVVIPANDSQVVLNIVPIVDNIPEGTEYLKIYIVNGCSSTTPTDSTIIQIRDYDTLTVAPDTIRICRNSSTSLGVYSTYDTYQWTPAATIDDPTSISPVVSPVADSTMYYCISSTGDCHGLDSSFVYWKKINVDSSQNIFCRADSTGIIYTHAGPEWTNPQFSVNNGPMQPGGTFTGLPVGDYIVSLYDGSGCADTAHVSLIQQYPDLVINNVSTTDGGCIDGAFGTITIQASGGLEDYTYSSDGITFQNSTPIETNPGTYTVVVKDANGCTASEPNVVVNYINSLTLSLSSDTTIICEGTNTTLHATSNGTSLQWMPASSLNTASGENVVASPTQTTKYIVTATLGICTLTDSIPLAVNPAPKPNAGNDQVICYGGSTQLSGSGGVQYHWDPPTYLSNPDINNPDVDHPENISYYLSVVDANGCNSLVADTIKITLLPPAELFAGNDTIVAVSQPLQLHAKDVNQTGFTSYTWSPSGVFNNPYIPNPIATLRDEYNTLIVIATTPGGCSGVDTVKVQTFVGPEVYIPNAFTPNGDGLNDVLRPVLVGVRNFNYFRIYNRYGQMIFNTTSQGEGWDGRYKGKLQPMGTYVWMIDAIDYKGNRIFKQGTVIIFQ